MGPNIFYKNKLKVKRRQKACEPSEAEEEHVISDIIMMFERNEDG